MTLRRIHPCPEGQPTSSNLLIENNKNHYSSPTTITTTTTQDTITKNTNNNKTASKQPSCQSSPPPFVWTNQIVLDDPLNNHEHNNKKSIDISPTLLESDTVQPKQRHTTAGPIRCCTTTTRGETTHLLPIIHWNDVTCADMHAQRGIKFFHMEEYALSMMEFTRALQINPFQSEFYRLRAGLHQHLFSSLSSLSSPSSLLMSETQPCKNKNNTNTVENHNRCSRVRESGSEQEQRIARNRTIEDLSKAIALNPQCYKSLFERACTLYFAAEYDRARMDINRSIQLKLQCATTENGKVSGDRAVASIESKQVSMDQLRLWRAKILIAIECYDGAMEDLEDLLSRSPNNSQVQLYAQLCRLQIIKLDS